MHPSQNQRPGDPPPAPAYPQPYPQAAGLPAAPPVVLDDPGAKSMDNPLRLVIILMFVNLGLSVLVTLVSLVTRNSLINYQLAHLRFRPGAGPEAVDLARHTLETSLWVRLGATVLVAALYIWRAYALRRGSRGAYLRLLWIGGVGIAGVIYLIVAGQYPVWMRVEQVVQGLVLVGLLYAVTRREVRDRFAKPRYQ